MNRRAVLQSLGAVSTHALFPSILLNFVSGCQNSGLIEENYSAVFFSPEEFQLMEEVVDIILPVTKSKSAAQVNTHHFLDEVFSKCMDADQQSVLKEGLAQLLPAFASTQNKLELLQEIDRKAYSGDEEVAYFRALKQYTLIGFFTSQEGTTVASKYVKFPGDYQGEIPSDEETLNYGKTNLRYYL